MTVPELGRPVRLGRGRTLARLVLVALTVIVAPAGMPVPASAAPAVAPAGQGISFGIFPGGAKVSAVQAAESQVARSFAYIRVYRSWDDTFPDADVTWMRSTGHSLFLSIKARLKSGANVSYQAIADSQPGDALYQNMVRWATAIKGYGLPIYVAFNHEPDTTNSQKSGTPTQFVAAWRKWVSVMDSQGVTNARWAYVTAVRNYSISPTSNKYAPKYYPGDAWLDVIAVDAYNQYCKRNDGQYAYPWRSLATLLDPFLQFVAQHPGIPLVLAEWGSAEDPNQSGRKAQWIADAQQMFKQPAYQRFVAISYWSAVSHEYAGCSMAIDTSASALNAYKAMANDPFYAGQVN